MVVLWWYYGCFMFINQKVFLFLPSIQIKKNTKNWSPARINAQEKKTFLWFTKIDKHEKDFCRASLLFLMFYYYFFFFCGLIFIDFTDFEFSLIVLSKLIHTNCRPISVNFIFFREALKDLLLTETISTIPSKCKILKILIFCSLSREHLLWKCSRERERNISILTILHLSFYFPVWCFLNYYLQSGYYPTYYF